MLSSRVFLTGATGVLGGQLLKQLLQTTSSMIYCLVRAPSTTQASERLRNFLRVYDPEGLLSHDFERRVRIVNGELTQDSFGLPEEQYATLTRTIDVVIHAAALTNLFLSYRRIEPVNVEGTRRMIEFALQTRQKYLCYVSTYTVMGDRIFDPNFIFRESDYDVGQGFAHMTYQQSKFVAEGMVRRAEARGLRWNIFRPGQIFGESESGLYPQGEANIIGLFYDIFKTVIETGVAFSSSTHFDVVPVDYVSHAILRLGLEPKRFFEISHLTNPDHKTYSQVIELLKSLGYPITLISQADYKRMLFRRELTAGGLEYKSPTISAFRWWFKREGFDFGSSAATDCELTRKRCAAEGVFCPPIDTKLMRNYIQACIRRQFLAEPEHAVRSAEASL